MQISPGLYRHYKGGEYYVNRIATHSETREPLVVYRCLYDDFSWWVRPLSMFTETLEVAGRVQARFTFVAPMSLAEADALASGRTEVSATEEDLHWMACARQQADLAEAAGEVPVGAVLVKNGEVLGQGFNQLITRSDPTAHAEIIALRAAAAQAANYRLSECTLYVTLEPCTMCVGAMIHARIGRLVYGTTEPKAGVIESQARLAEAPYLNHVMQITGGVDRQACQRQLSDFFKQRRALAKAARRDEADET